MKSELRDVGFQPTSKSCPTCLLPWTTSMEIELQEGWESNSDKFDNKLYTSRYTSLQDIIQSSPSPLEVISELYSESRITIKNQLVRRAASAYVQSSAVAASSRLNPNGFIRLWNVMKTRAVVGFSWNKYAKGLRCCFPRRISWFFVSIARRVRARRRR